MVLREGWFLFAMLKGMDMDAHIRESNLIEGIDNPDFDDQAMIAWDYLENQPKLTHHVVRKTQKIITLLQADLMPHQRGYYRDMSETNVRVGSFQAPHYSEVETMMENWLLSMDYPENVDPKAAHRAFELIHPFVDGNGRTGRMLMWWHELKRGRAPTLIKYDERFAYYDWFK